MTTAARVFLTLAYISVPVGVALSIFTDEMPSIVITIIFVLMMFLCAGTWNAPYDNQPPDRRTDV